MVDTTTEPSLNTLEKVLTALAALGQATAAKVGESVGIAYSTTTPRLRELESAGQAEKIRTNSGTTLWQLTAAGTAAVAAISDRPNESAGEPTPAPTDAGPDDPDEAAGDSPPASAEQPDSDDPTDGPASNTDEPDQVEPDTPIGKIDGKGKDPAGAGAGTVAAGEDDAGTGAETNDHGDAQSATPEPPAPEATEADTAADPADASDPSVNEAQTSKRRKPGRPRRGKGELRNEVLTLLQKNPDTSYKVAEICKLLDKANEDADVNKASAGAVSNDLDKLVGEGSVQRLDGKVATYQAV
jgi:hypothetical protein